MSINDKEILSFKEAVLFLGVSESFLYKLTFGKFINYYKPNGKLIYFKKEDLVNWMLTNKQSSIQEVENLIFNNLKKQ